MVGSWLELVKTLMKVEVKMEVFDLDICLHVRSKVLESINKSF